MPRAPRVSATTEGLSSSVFQALRARARDMPRAPAPLHVGDTWREPPECARCETLEVASHPGVHAYAPPHGEPRLLDVLEARLSARAGRPIAREAIQVVAGATSGLSTACQALLDPGDEVLVPTPCWPLVTGIVRSRGAVPVEVPVMAGVADTSPLALERALERACTPSTAAIYLNTPHNPTGRVLADDEVAAFARVAERHDLWVLCDEVYEDLAFAPAQPTPSWVRDDLASRAVATHSVSKSHGLAGARVGWTHGPLDAVRAIRAVFTQQAYCVARPMQHVAAAALEGGDAWLEETRALHARAAARMAAALGEPPPASGSFVFFRAPAWCPQDDALPFLERCLDEGVLLTPGAACGRDFAGWARACFTTLPPHALDDALERLARATATTQRFL